MCYIRPLWPYSYKNIHSHIFVNLSDNISMISLMQDSRPNIIEAVQTTLTHGKDNMTILGDGPFYFSRSPYMLSKLSASSAG